MPASPLIDEWDYLTTDWSEIYYNHDVESEQKQRYKDLLKILGTLY